MIKSIETIREYTSGMDYCSFIGDKKTLDAVIRHLAVIGEAAWNIPTEITEQYNTIPWREMRDLRNVVIHEYFGINKKILWETIQYNLPVIVSSLVKITKETPE